MHFFKKFFDAANQSAEAVNRQIIRITQRNFNAGLDLAKSLASAKDPFEIAKLQASFWWKQLNECTAQAEEVHKRLFGFSAVPERTPEPDLRAPAQKSLTRPLQEHRLDCARSRYPRGQSKSLLSKKSRRRRLRPKPLRPLSQKLVDRNPGFKEALQKRDLREDPHPEPLRGNEKSESLKQRRHLHARSFAQMLLGHMKDNPELQKRAAPHEPAPQVLPMGVKFGMLDGNAVRFTNIEAWWLIDGAWRPISPGEVLSNAAVMREARFKEVFPQLPILPRKAFQSDRRGES